MPISSRRMRLLSGTFGVAALAAMQYPAAQTPAPAAPPSRMLQLMIVDVRPDMANAYTDLIKGTAIPALQKAGVKWGETWRTAVFGDSFQVAHVTEIADWAQYDGPPPMKAGLGDAEYTAYLAKVRTMVSGVKSYALRTRPDLSYFADQAARPKMAILTNVEVAADRVMDFETFIKGDWMAALKKGGGKHYAVSQVVYGGSIGEFVTLVGVDSFADVGKGHPVTRALGEAGAMKLTAKAGAYTRHVERRLIRLDPDLSFEAGATTSQ